MRSSALPLFPLPCLLADVGGTNARFSLLGTNGLLLSLMLRLETSGAADFTDTVRRAVADGGYPALRSFLLAVAGPVVGQRSVLSNAATTGGALRIDGPALASALGLDQGLLLNDFEALCLSLPFLKPDAMMTLGEGTSLPGAPMVAVGPGTGLGVGALLRHGSGWLPVASEGGHVGLGPEGVDEIALWPHLGEGMIAAEDVLSGRGLSRLYRGICAMVAGESRDATPAAITERALAGTDPQAADAVRTFFRLLARFSGDTALTFGAQGGLFIGGGIAPRFRHSAWLNDGSFAAGARNRGRASGYLAGVPIHLITAADAALQGLAAVAVNPDQFDLDLKSRLWR